MVWIGIPYRPVKSPDTINKLCYLSVHLWLLHVVQCSELGLRRSAQTIKTSKKQEQKVCGNECIMCIFHLTVDEEINLTLLYNTQINQGQIGPSVISFFWFSSFFTRKYLSEILR